MANQRISFVTCIDKLLIVRFVYGCRLIHAGATLHALCITTDAHCVELREKLVISILQLRVPISNSAALHFERSSSVRMRNDKLSA
jgi:hypothetical protein